MQEAPKCTPTCFKDCLLGDLLQSTKMWKVERKKAVPLNCSIRGAPRETRLNIFSILSAFCDCLLYSLLLKVFTLLSPTPAAFDVLVLVVGILCVKNVIWGLKSVEESFCYHPPNQRGGDGWTGLLLPIR